MAGDWRPDCSFPTDEMTPWRAAGACTQVRRILLCLASPLLRICPTAVPVCVWRKGMVASSSRACQSKMHKSAGAFSGTSDPNTVTWTSHCPDARQSRGAFITMVLKGLQEIGAKQGRHSSLLSCKKGKAQGVLLLCICIKDR